MAAISDFFDGMHGVIFPFGGTTAPDGFVMCDGRAVNRAAYAALFAVIGTAFGAGDGNTTFNVPDLRGRVIAGLDNMGGTAAGRLTNSGVGNPGVAGSTLGAAGGVDRQAMTAAQMPSHQHGISGQAFGQLSRVAGNGEYVVHGGVGSAQSTAYSGANGSGEAQPNVQPTMVLNYIIKI